MINKLLLLLKQAHSRQYITMALAKGAATSVCREIDAFDPQTWEFSAFSQSGGDGIIDYLSRRIKNPNRYFIEIGSSKGMENNTSWLGIARKYSGLWVEGNRSHSTWSETLIAPLNLGIECISLKVTSDNIYRIKEKALFLDPDVFSLDIDGIDYYVMKSVFNAGFSPKICVVEYNATFGPALSSTISYQKDFDYTKAHPTRLYFGVSVNGWIKFFSNFGYRFVGVDSNGVDAYFIRPDAFDRNFVEGIKGIAYKENFYHARKFKTSWEKQFELIADMEFTEIE
ncbi:MAG: hypothetical protein ABIK15_21430 [Pseudomonadota bacterium]